MKFKKQYLLGILYVQNYFRLVRLPNLIIIIFAQIFTRLFLIEPNNLDFLNWVALICQTKFLLICISTTLIAGAGYVINDYYDIKIDLINKPQRVIIGKIIPRRWAVSISQLMNFLGIGLGFFINKKIFLVNALMVLLLWAYANHFKRTAFWGNLIVAFTTAMSIYILNLFFSTGKNEVLIYAIFSFFITLIREIVKDMEDIKGDQKHGCQTLPIVLGIFSTKKIIYTLKLCFLILLILLSPQDMKASNYVFLLVVLLAMLWAAYKLYFADNSKKFRYLSHYLKYMMIVGILSMMIY